MNLNLEYETAESLFQAETRRASVKTKRGERILCTDVYVQDLYQMMASYEVPKSDFKVGEVLKGKYHGTTEKEYLIDINAKDYIRVDKSRKETMYFEGMEEGDEVSVLIIGFKDDPYLIKGSVSEISDRIYGEELKSLKNDESVDIYIESLTPAGFNVEINYGESKFLGFMPHTLTGVNKLTEEARERLVGQTLKAMVESYSQEKGTYIVSRRKYLKSKIKEETKKLEFGKVYTGHVTDSRSFGVFIEFNECLTTMIHVSNINPIVADKIADIKAGTEIDFYIQEIQKDGKIISTQILKETLWDTLTEGSILNGIVKEKKEAGLLVQLSDDVNGFIPTKLLGNKKYDIGSKVRVKAITVDRTSRKIYLVAIG